MIKKTGLELMREPFAPHLISKLPKGTKAQNECDPGQKKNCSICGGWHHPQIKHLDYVGHAALTDRLLDADPTWTWEPMAKTEQGLPAFDASGGLWIRLTVCGVTRLGYGNAEKKSFGDAGAREKEIIGDALRNAGMRFGAALDLWHKGDLHIEAEEDGNAISKPPPVREIAPPLAPPTAPTQQPMPQEVVAEWLDDLQRTESVADLKTVFGSAWRAAGSVEETSAKAQFKAAYDRHLATLEIAA